MRLSEPARWSAGGRLPDAPDGRVLSAARMVLEGVDSILTPNARVAALLEGEGAKVVVADVARRPAHAVDAVVLIADELSAAGEHAEGLLDAAVAAVRPRGWIVVSATSALHPSADTVRAYSSDQLRRALGHHGIAVELLFAPGAGAIVRGDPRGGFDPVVDRLPGLLDAAPRLLAAGRAAGSTRERSDVFFSTLPYKVVAAGVLCRDADGRLLCVHDSFKQAWTIPGGVVDADEDPRSGAVREAWEEAGVRVSAGAVLGVFAASAPDRVVLVYDATPIADADHRHAPVHAHEIDDVAWIPLDRALDLLAPHVAEQVRCCLEDPGGTLRQHRA